MAHPIPARVVVDTATLYRQPRGLQRPRISRVAASASDHPDDTRRLQLSASSHPETKPDIVPQSPFHTGGAHITTSGATASLTGAPLVGEKTIYVLRHGLTTWNVEGRIQGSSNDSQLTAAGRAQAARCREALVRIPFDSCFHSPITRAATTASIIWEGRQGSLIPLDSLREAHLGFFQGMRNVDAAAQHPDLYRCWREQPAAFCIEGRYPVVEVFGEARLAWADILRAPGQAHLVVTHKSILRAFLCVALGLPPAAFRAVDVNNGGVSVFRVNTRAEPMLCGLNYTAHMHCDHVRY